MHISSTISPGPSLLAFAREIAPAKGPGQTTARRLAPLLWIGAAAIAAVLIARGGDRFLVAIERALHSRWQLVVAGAALELASIGGYVLLLHRMVATRRSHLRLKDSYDITLAGAAATRLLPTAGLGGAAVSVWALRARGLRSSEITERLLAFFLILYGVYMSALLVSGATVALGVVSVPGGRALGVLGVVIALAVSGAALALLASPALVARLLQRAGRGSGRAASAAGRIAAQLPELRHALGRAWHELRAPRPALLGAVAWWAFDIGVMVAMLHAFGVGLPLPAVVLAYFLGTLFNMLPLPGSLSGGLAAALIALGAHPGGAIAAVMAYRALAVWLPAAAGLASVAALRASVERWRSEGRTATGGLMRQCVA